MGNFAVEDGIIQHLSASQIGTFIACPTLWWIEKKARVPPPPDQDTTALDTGTSMHGEHEDYFNDGVMPKHGSLRRLIEHPRWPKRSKHLLIEHPRSYKLGITAAGVNLKGRIDLLDGSDLTSPLVCDLKSMSTYRYALNAEALSRDCQLTIYGKYVFSIYPQAQSVRYAHGQALSKAEDARVVMTDPLTRAHVDQVFESIESVAARMVEVALIEDINDVPRDETGERCGKFRGCVYKYLCPKFAVDDWADYDSTPAPQPGEASMTLKEKFAARDAGAVVGAGSAINPMDAAKPAPVTRYVPPSVDEAPSVSATPVVAAEDAPTSTFPTLTNSTGLLVLFVNCAPTNTTGTSLESVIAATSPAIAAKHKVSDVRLVPYGVGTAELVAAIVKNPPTGIVIATTNGLSGPVVDALIPLAATVVRGF